MLRVPVCARRYCDCCGCRIDCRRRMTTRVFQSLSTDDAYNDGYGCGYEQGCDDGANGHSYGYGYADGYDDGYSECKKDG